MPMYGRRFGLAALVLLAAVVGLLLATVDALGVADINGDGAVNVFDLVLVGANFGRAAPLPW